MKKVSDAIECAKAEIAAERRGDKSPQFDDKELGQQYFILLTGDGITERIKKKSAGRIIEVEKDKFVLIGADPADVQARIAVLRKKAKDNGGLDQKEQTELHALKRVLGFISVESLDPNQVLLDKSNSADAQKSEVGQVHKTKDPVDKDLKAVTKYNHLMKGIVGGSPAVLKSKTPEN